MQLGAHRQGGRWSDSGCSWKESGHDCRWMRKNVVKGGSEAYGLKWDRRWRGNRRSGLGGGLRCPLHTPGTCQRAAGTATPRAQGRGRNPGLAGLWGTGSHEDRWDPRGERRCTGKLRRTRAWGAASGDAAGRSERTELSTALSNAVTGDLGDFSGVTMFLSLRALVSLHIDC